MVPKSVFASAVMAAWVSCALEASASAQSRAECGTRITRENLTGCAVGSSLAVLAEQRGTEALRGRERAAATVLPSNPVASFSLARRQAPAGGAEAVNWQATIGQEIEVAGQRGLRRETAGQQRIAQEQRTIVTRRDVAAEAWRAFFEARSADEEVTLATDTARVAESVAKAARARNQEGLSSDIDAEVAEATALRQVQARIAAERRRAEARARLAVAVGLDPLAPVALEGDLAPLSGVEEAARRTLAPTAAAALPEARALAAERDASVARADLLRRLRIPNPLVSVFVQNDGFDERVLGLGLSLPIPLPSPVGKTYGGEIVEAEANAKRIDAERAIAERSARLAIANALTSFDARKAEASAITPERARRASASLDAIADEVGKGRLAIKDAIVAQQALMELRVAEVATRRALAIASVDLARAAGMDLESAR